MKMKRARSAWLCRRACPKASRNRWPYLWLAFPNSLVKCVVHKISSLRKKEMPHPHWKPTAKPYWGSSIIELLWKLPPLPHECFTRVCLTSSSPHAWLCSLPEPIRREEEQIPIPIPSFKRWAHYPDVWIQLLCRVELIEVLSRSRTQVSTVDVSESISNSNYLFIISLYRVWCLDICYLAENNLDVVRKTLRRSITIGAFWDPSPLY